MADDYNANSEGLKEENMKRYAAILLVLAMLMGTGAWAEQDFSVSGAPSEALSSARAAVS